MDTVMLFQNYPDLEDWHIREIGQALAEADAEDFATEDEVAAVVGKYES